VNLGIEKTALIREDLIWIDKRKLKLSGIRGKIRFFESFSKWGCWFLDWKWGLGG